jgi:hypothetical protein
MKFLFRSLAACAVLAGCNLTGTSVSPERMPRFEENGGPKPRVALVLGSGVPRGFAHIGVLKVLDDAGVRPDIIIVPNKDPFRHPTKGWTSNFAILRNLSFKACTGDVILWLDADDVLVNGAEFRKFVEEAQQRKGSLIEAAVSPLSSMPLSSAKLVPRRR